MTPLLDYSSAWYCENQALLPCHDAQHAGNEIYSTMTTGERQGCECYLPE